MWSITEETVESDAASSMFNDEISPQMELSSSLWTEGAVEDMSVTVKDSEGVGEDSRSSCCKHQYIMLAIKVKIILWFTCMDQSHETSTFYEKTTRMCVRLHENFIESNISMPPASPIKIDVHIKFRIVWKDI